MSSTRTGEDPSFQGDGSNWTIAYVIVFLIPIIFFAIAVYSTWKDRRAAAAKAKDDLETGRAVKMDRYFHPWRYGEAADAHGSANQNGANRSNLTIATTAAASGAAGSTSRHSSNPRGLAASRGGNNGTMAPVTPWFARPEQRRISVMTNPYRPSYDQPQNRAQQQQQQQQPQQHPSQQSKIAIAEPYLPRPTTSISDEADAMTGRPSGEEEEQSGWKDGSDLRHV